MHVRLPPFVLAAVALAGAATAPAAHAAWSPATTLAQRAAEVLAAAGNAQRHEACAWSSFGAG